MKHSCDIIRDLLPLYIDDVASPSSRQMVEEHLAECADCQAMLGRLRNEEAETAVTAERENVIAGQRSFFKRRSAVAGSVIAGVFMVPVLVCLIVNLATGSGLDWFFIVLASLLTAASLSIVPLMAPDNKGLWTLGCFTVSLLLLFAVCCLYTGGRWFFVAAAAVLFGLSVIFLPFAAKSEVVSGYLGDRRGIAVMGADTVLYLVMMLVIGIHARSARFFVIAGAISVPVLLLAWGLFFLIRNRRKNRPAPARAEARNASAVRQDAEPKRRLQTWEIVLLAVGSPIWLALLIAAFAVALSVYVVIWAVIVSLWAAVAACAVGAVGAAVLGSWTILRGGVLRGVVTICAGLVLAGLSIFLFCGCRAATRGALALTKNITSWIRSLFERKENVK